MRRGSGVVGAAIGALGRDRWRVADVLPDIPEGAAHRRHRRGVGPHRKGQHADRRDQRARSESHRQRASRRARYSGGAKTRCVRARDSRPSHPTSSVIATFSGKRSSDQMTAGAERGYGHPPRHLRQRSHRSPSTSNRRWHRRRANDASSAHWTDLASSCPSWPGVFSDARRLTRCCSGPARASVQTWRGTLRCLMAFTHRLGKAPPAAQRQVC